MNTKMFFTFQHIDCILNEKDKKKFLYNGTMYNLSILDNYVNKFLDIKFRQSDFFMKKDTNPIWGFQFNDNESINIFSKTSRNLCISGAVVLIVYTIDDIDLKYAVSVKKQMLKYAYNNTKNSKPKFKTVVPLDQVPFNRHLKLLTQTSNNIFIRHPFEFDKSYVALPRLRSKNIKMIVSARELDKYFDDFNKALSEEELLNLLKEKGSNLFNK